MYSSSGSIFLLLQLWSITEAMHNTQPCPLFCDASNQNAACIFRDTDDVHVTASWDWEEGIWDKASPRFGTWNDHYMNVDRPCLKALKLFPYLKSETSH